MPLQEATQVAPPNIWFTLNALSNGQLALGTPLLSFGAMIGVLILGSLFFYRHRQALKTVEGLLSGWIFIFSAFMLLSPKSLGNYAAIFLMPLTFVVLLRNDRFALGLTLALNFLVSMQPSLWYRLGSPTHVSLTFLQNPLQFAEFSMELLALVVLAAIAMRCQRWVALWETRLQIPHASFAVGNSSTRPKKNS